MLSDEARLTIRTNFNLSFIDHIINQSLPACTIWGDLEITSVEYDNINSRIRDHLGEVITFASLNYLFKRYPSVLLTSLVGFALYDYDETFWDSWSGLFGLSPSSAQSVHIGRLALAHLKANNFEVIEDEGYIYVSPILYQAGIPGNSYFRLFSVIDSTLSSRSFSPREIVIELTGNRSNLIDAAARRYFERNQEDAVEVVGDLQEMMRVLAAFNEDSTPDSSAWPERVVDQYWKWRKEISHSKRKKGADHQIYFSPRLVYDEIKGICLMLPEQTLRDDSVYRLRWEILSSAPSFKQLSWSDVHRIEEKNITMSSLVPVPPAEEYSILIYDDDKADAPLCPMWTLPGISREESVLIFDSMGRRLSGDSSLQRNKGTAVVWKSSRETGIEHDGISQEDLYLQKTWSEFKGTRIYPIGPSASFTIHTVTGNQKLICTPSLEFELSHEPTLFDEPYREDETPVFTRFPNLEILGRLDEDPTFLKEGKIILRCRDTGLRHTAKLSDLPVSTGEDFAVIALRDWVLQEFSGRFGSYSLSIHKGRTNRASLSFYYAPSVPCRSDVKAFQSQYDLLSREPALYVPPGDIGRLRFDDPDLLKKVVLLDGSTWIQLRRRDNQATLTGTLKLSDQIEIPFRKTLRQLEWTFWPESGDEEHDHDKTRTFSLGDLKRKRWRMELRFTDPSIQYDSLCLHLAAGDGTVLQSKDLSLDSRGRCYETLNRFQDTIQANELPLRLLLKVKQGQEEYQPVALAAFKHFVQLKEPRYMTAGGRPVITWQECNIKQTKKLKLTLIALSDPSRKEIVEQSLKGLRCFTKDGRTFHGIYLDASLEDGVYFIDAVEDDPFAFFEEEETAISYDSQHILFVNAEEYLQAHYALKTREAGKWLAAAVVAQYKLEWIQALSQRLSSLLSETGYKNAWQFDVEKSSHMLFSAVLSTFGQSDLDPEARTLFRDVYRSLSDEVITNRQRTRLLQILSDSSYSTSEIQHLIQELQLYLFSPDGKTLFSKRQLHRIWGIHEKLAMLINLRDSAENPAADVDRIIHHLGEDTLQAVITFNDQNCSSDSWSECIECLILNHGDCPSARFNKLERVTGDGKEFANLFAFTGRRQDPAIRKPTREDTLGYPVLGKTYLDLLFESSRAHDHHKTHGYFTSARTWVPTIDELSTRHQACTRSVESVLAKRRDSSNDIGRHFFEIGRASLFSALETSGTVQYHETQKLLPFWRISKEAYPDLVYRDLIMAELYAISMGGR